MYRYFIGANNQTGQVEQDKAIGVFTSQGIEGLTAYKASGYWQGKAEKSLIVEVEGISKQLAEFIASALCKALDQQAVGIEKLPVIRFISQSL